jgi:NADH-quinone oxidoreductase subunit J
VQVLIYVGAVVVLLLFGIMLTRAPIGRSEDLDSGNRIVAIITAGATAVVLVTTLVRGFRDAYFPLKSRVGSGGTSVIGAGIFRTWVLPFEALSVLLLAALIGAIVLSRSDIGPRQAEPEPDPPRRPRVRTPGPLVRRKSRKADDEDTIVLARIDEEA